MKNYVLLIGNGNGSRSRGLDIETLYTFKTQAENIDDAINKLESKIRKIDVGDDYEEYEDDDEIDYASYFNDQDVGDGHAWLIAYIENGKMKKLYPLKQLKNEGVGYDFNDYNEAEQFNLEPCAGKCSTWY